jgi:PIN domain
MKTVLENLRVESQRLRDLLRELLAHSSIRRWHNPNVDGFVYVGGNYAWNQFNAEAIQIQAKILEEYRRFFAVVRTLLREQTEGALGKLEQADSTILEVIQQQATVYTDDADKYFKRAITALESQVELLEGLYGPSDAKPFVVPDTNALIFNPDLEKWKFDGTPQFTLVLIPAVLSELDSLKVNHRVETVREKAEKVISRIKEYRRRAAAAGGRLTDGAVVVTGVSNIIAIAVEPKMEASLPWLDPASKDDQILASVIEVMRMRPRSPVLLVTRDINLQNKAEFANIPFVEPPDPI